MGRRGCTIFGVLFFIPTVVIAAILYRQYYTKLTASLGMGYGSHYYATLGVLVWTNWTDFISFFETFMGGRSNNFLGNGSPERALAIATVNLSFEGEGLDQVVMFPLAYRPMNFLWSPFLICLFRFAFPPTLGLRRLVASPWQ